MSGASDVELTIEQRQLLELVYEHFDRTLAWPEAGLVKRELYQRGYRKIVMNDVLLQLSPALLRKAEISGERLRLTLRGFRALNRMIELNDFVCLLRCAVDRYGEHAADKKLSITALGRRCGMDAHRLRKLDLLLAAEIYVARSAGRGPEGEPSEWEVDDEVTRYQDVFTIDGYLEARAREMRALADADIPPIHLLAAEGIPWQPPAPEPTAAAGPSSDLGTSIADGVLRSRCGDLLVLGAPFDRVIREAAVVLEDRVRGAVGGSDRIGVSLMEFAFSARVRSCG